MPQLRNVRKENWRAGRCELARVRANGHSEIHTKHARRHRGFVPIRTLNATARGSFRLDKALRKLLAVRATLCSRNQSLAIARRLLPLREQLAPLHLPP